MVKDIVRDTLFLSQKSTVTTKDDAQVARDLQDTLKAYRQTCVGMAANMIGYKKRTIIVSLGIMDMIMHNPVILSKKGEYETEEGCLSLSGQRATKRYREIEVEFEDINFKKQKQVFRDRVAQIIQHEMDHLEGILI